MDAASIASAAVYAQHSQTSGTMAAVLTKQVAEQEQAMANMILAMAENLQQVMSAPPPGQGQNVDIRA